MNWVTISSAAHDALAAFDDDPDPNANWDGERLPNGDWRIPLPMKALERLAMHSKPGDTISDVILRMCEAVKPRH